MKDSNPEINITVSEIITREDDQLIKAKIKEVNNGLSRYCQQNSWCFLKHANINKRVLNKYGLHLNRTSTAILANNIISHIKILNCV